MRALLAADAGAASQLSTGIGMKWVGTVAGDSLDDGRVLVSWAAGGTSLVDVSELVRGAAWAGDRESRSLTVERAHSFVSTRRCFRHLDARRVRLARLTSSCAGV